MKACVVCAVVLALAAGSWAQLPARVATGDLATPALEGFCDGQWALKVDRAWDGTSGNPVFPSDPLEESDYEPVDAGPTYLVTVSGGAAVVAIGQPPITGTRALATDERVRFDLTEGTFAGGRLIVWSTDRELQAEFTIYGSGRPIIHSERGQLLQDPRADRLFLPACTRRSPPGATPVDSAN